MSLSSLTCRAGLAVSAVTLLTLAGSPAMSSEPAALSGGASAGRPAGLPADWASRVTVADLLAAAGGEQPIDPQALDFAEVAAAIAGRVGGGPAPAKKGEKPSWKDLSEGFEKVVSTAEGDSLYGLYIKRETNDLLAELPRGFDRQKHFFAMTVAGGELFAGLQAGDLYTYWKQYGEDRLALIAPEINVRSSGDQESKDSVEMIFTDRVLLDVAILGKGPNGQPVIDLDELLVGQATKFFGGSAIGLQGRLKEVTSAKAFPENIEVAFEVPDATGTLKTFHYSISDIRGTPGYKPREADTRVGYFTTSFRDLGKFDRDEVFVRYVNRWHLEKADPKLKLSPPKEPIVYYVEHTVPVRYRRWVREGIEYWNKAYEKVGILGAIEVRFQDKSTGQHMEKDPEDVRYNFVRWLSNDVATAIGPSRVNPMTGQILDADVVLTDGWVRVFTYRWEDLLGEIATEGFGAETMSWLQDNPRYDPRVRMATPGDRERMLRDRRALRGVQRFGGAPIAVETAMLGDEDLDGLVGRTSQVNGLCRAAEGKALGLATARVFYDVMGMMAPVLLAADEDELPELPPEAIARLKEQLEKNPELLEFMPEKYRKLIEKLMNEGAVSQDDLDEATDEDEGEEEESDDTEKKSKKKDKKDLGDLIDGVPESFVGPMLAELVAHEVGHTLGLRHNFKASGAYTLEEINSEEFKGKKPWSASVMDYNGINIRMPKAENSGTVQGDFSSIDIGPYDYWAIEYGYTLGETDKVLERVAEPELQYGTDEDTSGPDPLARRYDLSKNPLDWAKGNMELARFIRENLVEKFVKDGESWSRTRQGYQIALGQHVASVSAIARWLGGAYVYRDKKGDPNGRPPIDPVSAATQREALEFVTESTFRDEAFGLTPELLKYMTVDKWYDDGGLRVVFTDPTFDLNDRILGVQASTLTMIMNPTTLRRMLDGESYVEPGEDVLTVAEALRTITGSIWTELDAKPAGKASNREPVISTLRRNLQREHLDRLIDLAVPGESFGAVNKVIANLATMHLREIEGKIAEVMEKYGTQMDDYSKAHLQEVAMRIDGALDPEYIYNTDKISGGGGIIQILLGEDEAGKATQR